MLGVDGNFEDAVLSMMGGITWSSWGFLRWDVKEERTEANGSKPLFRLLGVLGSVSSFLFWLLVLR